jgi:hypothetical protein
MLLALVVSLAAWQDGSTTLLRFDHDAPGKPPEGWVVEGTKQEGQCATWAVTHQAGAPSPPAVLALTAVNHDSSATFNLCWTDRIRMRDGRIEVKLRAHSGAVDQGGGIMWRVKDKDNYMVARWNPLEENFRVYSVKDGTRRQLASAKVTLPAGGWHALAIVQSGPRVECFLDGTRHLEATADHVPDEGGVGLWTKADAATWFDDLKITRSAATPPQPGG